MNATVPEVILALPGQNATAQMANATSAGPLARAAAGATDALGQALPAAPAFSWASYFWAIFVLFLVLGGLWAVLALLKKKGGLKVFGVAENFQVEARIPLGPKKHLMLVRFLNKRLLLGVTDHQITKLAELSADEYSDLVQPENRGKSGGRPASDFQAILEKADPGD